MTILCGVQQFNHAAIRFFFFFFNTCAFCRQTRRVCTACAVQEGKGRETAASSTPKVFEFLNRWACASSYQLYKVLLGTYAYWADETDQ